MLLVSTLGDFGEPLQGPAAIPFGSMGEYHLVSARDHSRFHHFCEKVLLGMSLTHASCAVGIWKRIVSVAIEELENLDALEIKFTMPFKW